nr:ATP-binding cassette domain-containing protein [Deefgea sp. CFH1-16]
MVNLLTVSNLSLRFAGANQPVVREVNLHLNAGEKLALVGESGSGKSVLAHSLLRLDREVIAEGEIEFAGQSLLPLPEAALRLIPWSAYCDDFSRANDCAQSLANRLHADCGGVGGV